jgi:hypothetical protein
MGKEQGGILCFPVSTQITGTWDPGWKALQGGPQNGASHKTDAQQGFILLQQEKVGRQEEERETPASHTGDGSKEDSEWWLVVWDVSWIPM